MKFRYTLDELQNEKSDKYMSDLKLLRSIVVERQQDCTNSYAPLYQRLQKLYNTLSKSIDNNNPLTLLP